MRAVIYRTYGMRHVLRLEDVPDPGAPGDDEVRIRVHASSINPVDGKVRRGELKLIAGGHFPKRPGLDFSGVVEAVGPGVDGLAVGDAVFGAAKSMSEGTFAEHAIVRAAAIARKPATLNHATAAGVPTVGIAALQALRDIVRVQTGEEVLVYGCTGGVGLFALQLGRAAGARMTGVCGTEGVTTALDYGANTVVDYRRGETVRDDMRFRAILELSGRLQFQTAEHLLTDHGLHVDFSPSPLALVGNAIANPFRNRKHVFAMTAAKTSDLQHLASAIDSGSLRPAPTRTLPLQRFAEAFELAEGGGVVGKIVVQISDQD